MRGLILTAVVFIAFSLNGISQQNDSLFYFYNQTDLLDYKSVDRSLLPANYFGEDIAIKLFLMQKSYTYIIKGTASSPGDKVAVEKPVIYSSVKKMTRYYKSMAKKGIMTDEVAKVKLDHVLNVGLSVKTQNTSKLEDAIKAAKKPDQLAKVYDRVVLR